MLLVGELEYEKDMRQAKSSQSLNQEKELQEIVDELEEDILVLQKEKNEMKQIAEASELAIENATNTTDSDALVFLQEKFSDVSKK